MGNCFHHSPALKNEVNQVDSKDKNKCTDTNSHLYQPTPFDLHPLPKTYSNAEMKNQSDTTWIRTQAQANAEMSDIKNRYFYPSDDWSIKKKAKRPNPNTHATKWVQANLKYRMHLRRTHSLFFDDRHYTPFPHRSDELGPKALSVIDDAEACFRRY